MNGEVAGISRRGNRIIIAILTAIILISFFFIFYQNHQSFTNTRDQVYARLSAIAQTISLSIDAEDHVYLTDKYTNKDDITTSKEDSIYLKYHELFKETVNLNMLRSSIYTLVYDSANRHFEFVITSSETPFYRHEYVKFPEKLLQNYDEGGTLDIYESENGKWISAFAPIRDAEGNTVAIVQVDELFSYFIDKAKSKLIVNLVITFIILMMISLGVIYYVNRNIRFSKEFENELINKNEEIKAQNEEISAQNEEISSQNEKINNYVQRLEGANSLIQDQNNRLWLINDDLDKKVQQRTGQLRKAVKNLNALLYRSSHDIKGPLASLEGVLHVAKLDVKDPAFQSYADRIQHALNRLKAVLSNIQLIYELRSRKVQARNFLWSDFFNLLQEEIMTSGSGVHCVTAITNQTTLYSDQVFLLETLKQLIQMVVKNDQKAELRLDLSESPKNFIITLDVNDPDIPEDLSRLENHQDLDFNLDLWQGAKVNMYIAGICMEAIHGKINLHQSQDKLSIEIKIPMDVDLFE